MRIALLLLMMPASVPAASVSRPSYLYDARLVQAAPGKILEVIDLYKARAASFQSGGDEPPLWMRHSQGDRWDLLLLFPMESQSEFFRPERLARRRKEAATTSSAMTRLRDLTAWQE